MAIGLVPYNLTPEQVARLWDGYAGGAAAHTRGPRDD
jgi:hypothetical protein